MQIAPRVFGPMRDDISTLITFRPTSLYNYSLKL